MQQPRYCMLPSSFGFDWTGNGFDTKNRIVFCIVIWVHRYFVPLNSLWLRPIWGPNRLVRAPASCTGPLCWLVPPLVVCYSTLTHPGQAPSPTQIKSGLKVNDEFDKMYENELTFGVSMRCDVMPYILFGSGSWDCEREVFQWYPMTANLF
jgi:hypothetical protein